MFETLRYILLLTSCTFFLVQCRKEHCLKAPGDVIRTERATTPFNEIDISDNINLVLTQDTVEKIVVEAGSSLAPNITTSMRDQKLFIRNESSCKWIRSPSEKITVYVSVRNLVRLTYNASGDVTTTNTLKAEGITFFSDEGAGNVDIDLEAKRTYTYIYNDNADMIFRGSSDSCYAYTGERGTIDFRDFVVKHQTVGYGSIREGFVHATASLHVIMYFKGTLYYKGNPPVVAMEQLSTGKIIPIR